MLPPGGSVDSWYMMRAVRQPFPSCFRRSQKEVQKRRESSLQINVRGIAGSAFEQRAYLAQERVHLLRAATDIGLWPQQNGEVFCMHGKSRLCRQLLQKVAGLASLHPYGGRVGTAAQRNPSGMEMRRLAESSRVRSNHWTEAVMGAFMASAIR